MGPPGLWGCLIWLDVRPGPGKGLSVSGQGRARAYILGPCRALNGSPGCSDSSLQIICNVGSGVCHLPLDNWVQVRRVCWPIKHSNTMVIEPAFGSFGSVGRCQVLLENEISISIKLVSRRKHEVLSNVLVDGCWLRTLENTVDQHQQMTWQPKSSLTVETLHWTSSNMDFVPLHSSSRLWELYFQIKCYIYFHLKRGLWTTEKQSSFFLLSPGKMLLTMFRFQKWLGSPFPEAIRAWWLLMQFSPCDALPSKCVNRLCLTVFSSLRSSLRLVDLFLPDFFLPVNFAFKMLWYSTPWTVTPFSNDPLWFTLFVEGVNDYLLDQYQVSSVPHYCGFKEQEIPRIYMHAKTC